jgi:hypothetical protein
MGRATRLAMGVAAGSLAAIVFGAARADAFSEDSDTASVTFNRNGVLITCTIGGSSSIGYDPQEDFSFMEVRTSLVGGPPACQESLFMISADAAYLRDGEQESEHFGSTEPKSGASASATVNGVVVSMDVRHEAVFACNQEPGDCFAVASTSPK